MWDTVHVEAPTIGCVDGVLFQGVAVLQYHVCMPETGGVFAWQQGGERVQSMGQEGEVMQSLEVVQSAC
jgi:hypothetical protein